MSSVALDAMVAPADAARAKVYRAMGGLVAPWARDRGLRVSVLGTLAIVIALPLAVGFPLWVLALGPILLGVPHVLADVRYLWVQPGFHRRPLVWLLVMPPLMVGAVAGDVSFGLGAAAIALFAVPASPLRRVLGVSVLLPLLALSVWYANAATLIFAHAHNGIALALWWAYRPDRGLRHAWVLGLFALAAAALGFGVFDAMARAGLSTFGGPVGTRSIDGYAQSLAPFADGAWGVRVVLLYAFAQSIHYAVWLRLVPEDARPRKAPRTFRSTFRALRLELGLPVLGVAAFAAVAVAAWAVVDLGEARDGYLRFAIFHGHLELAAAALIFAGGRPVRRAS